MIPESEIWGRKGQLGQSPRPQGSSLLPPQPRGLTVSGARAPLCFETTRRTPPEFSYLWTFFLDTSGGSWRAGEEKPSRCWVARRSPGAGLNAGRWGNRERRRWDCVVTSRSPAPRTGPSGSAEARGSDLSPPPRWGASRDRKNLPLYRVWG